MSPIARRPYDAANFLRDEDLPDCTATILECLARDIAVHPECLQPLDAALLQRLQCPVGDVEVDLDAPLLSDEVRPTAPDRRSDHPAGSGCYVTFTLKAK